MVENKSDEEKESGIKPKVSGVFKLHTIIIAAKDEAIFDVYKNMSQEFQSALPFKDYYYINRQYLDNALEVETKESEDSDDEMDEDSENDDEEED